MGKQQNVWIQVILCTLIGHHSEGMSDSSKSFKKKHLVNFNNRIILEHVKYFVICLLAVLGKQCQTNPVSITITTKAKIFFWLDFQNSSTDVGFSHFTDMFIMIFRLPRHCRDLVFHF